MVKALIAIALLAPLSFCSTLSIPGTLPCSVGPIILDKGASTRLTRAEKEQVVTVNETGAAICGWRAPS
jgi:hypothetical protein